MKKSNRIVSSYYFFALFYANKKEMVNNNNNNNNNNNITFIVKKKKLHMNRNVFVKTSKPNFFDLFWDFLGPSDPSVLFFSTYAKNYKRLMSHFCHYMLQTDGRLNRALFVGQFYDCGK